MEANSKGDGSTETVRRPGLREAGRGASGSPSFNNPEFVKGLSEVVARRLEEIRRAS